MDTVNSGPTTERIVRASVPPLVVLVFAVWFAWDGLYGWPRKNLEEAVAGLVRDGALDGTPDPLPAVNPRVTAESSEHITGEMPRSALSDRFGDATVREGNDAYYFGPGGMLVVTFVGDTVREREWRPAPRDRNETALAWQKAIAAVLAVFGLVLVPRMVHAATHRTTISDAGLSVRRRPPIPFDAITRIRAEHFAKKGYVDVEYTHGSATRTLRLDEYNIKEFSRILAALCDRKGFDNPAAPGA